MYKWRKPITYPSQFEADTAALTLSYRHGEEFFACEQYDGLFVIKGEATVFSPVFDKHRYRNIKGTRKMGWSKGLHKELGDDSPVKVTCKAEVPRRRYTWGN